MTTDLAVVYGKFVDYVTRLRADLDNTVGLRIPPDHRAQLMSFDDFCRLWNRWGDTDGLQETWRRRFDAGYDQVALAMGKRLEAALTGKPDGAQAPSTNEAA